MPSVSRGVAGNPGRLVSQGVPARPFGGGTSRPGPAGTVPSPCGFCLGHSRSVGRPPAGALRRRMALG